MSPVSDRLTGEEHAEVLEQIIGRSGLKAASSQAHPTAVILAGQPGAGKGGLARRAEIELDNDVIKIDPDALREFHPNVETFRHAHPYTWSGMTHADASQWADELLDATVSAKKNLIFDTTLSNGEWASGFIKDLQSKGYAVEVRVVAAHRLESEWGVDRRFTEKVDAEGHGRYVPEGARDAIYGKLPGSLDTIRAQTDAPIRIFSREGVELHDSRHDARAPGAALEEAREARLKDPKITRTLSHGWREQQEWHRDLPDAIGRNRTVDPVTARHLLAEHNELKVSEGVTHYANEARDIDFTSRIGPNLTRGTVALGGVASVTDAVRTGERVQTLLAQDNLLGAKHEVRDFAVNNANAWAAAYAVGKLGAEMGGRRGAYGAVAGGIAGGITGYVLSDKALQGLDGREIANQIDAQGTQWNYNGREWIRPIQADLREDGMDRPQERNFSADFDTRRELDYRATNTSVDLALRRLPSPRDPYSLSANEQDTPSSRPSNWERNPDTGHWTRQVHGPAIERGIAAVHTETATSERTTQLDKQAAEVIQSNIAGGPAAIAARYDVAHRLNGWDSVPGMGKSPAVATALDADNLQASDGHQYRFGSDGAWRHGSDPANDRIAAELSATRSALQPQLEQHAQVMASLSAWQRPTQDQQELASLATTYAGYGVAPNAESLAAIQQAVKTTRAQRGLDASATSLTLDPDARGTHDINSPIMHMRTDAGGVVRVAAVTTAHDIERAREQIRQHGPRQDDGVQTLAAVSVRPPRGTDDRESQVAVEKRDEPRSASLLADNPAHSDFDTFNRIHTWVQGTGQWDEEKSRNVASALYREQATDPVIKRVDKVAGAVGRDGAENVFAVYAPFGDKGPFFYATVDGRDAAQQPAQQNLEQAEQIKQQQVQQQQLEQTTQQDRQQRGAQVSM